MRVWIYAGMIVVQKAGYQFFTNLYADDVLLNATIQDCYQLQKDLDSLGKWSDKWKMVFNPQKCEFLRITNKKHPILIFKINPSKKSTMPNI